MEPEEGAGLGEDAGLGHDVPRRATAQPFAGGHIRRVLDAIDDRLASIERQVGIAGAAPESDELRRNSVQLARTRLETEAAFDAEDLVRASALRGKVRQLLAERELLLREPQVRRSLRATQPVRAAHSLRARQPSAAQLAELEKARGHIARLTALLHAHGIDPGDPT